MHLKVVNYTQNYTFEEEYIKNALNAMVEQNPEGQVVDLAPLINLAGCFGFDKNTFEAGIEGEHIILSINKSKTFQECDITQNMAAQTVGWVNELELNMFRYGTKRIEKKLIKA